VYKRVLLNEKTRRVLVLRTWCNEYKDKMIGQNFDSFINFNTDNQKVDDSKPNILKNKYEMRLIQIK